MRRLIASACAALALLAAAPAALAHPHIFIDATATIEFDETGAFSGIRNFWTFDEAFSAYYTQGLDLDNDGITTPEEMQELADENLDGLNQYGFYLSAGEGPDQLSFTGTDARIELVGDRARLSFLMTPAEPYAIRERLEIAIGDPEYYVAIELPDISAVTLVKAPAACAAHLEPPRDLPDDLLERLYSLPADITTLPPDLAAAVRGFQGAIVIGCGAGAAPPEPTRAVDAANAMAGARPAPFGGPPPEPGLAIPQSGPLRWIADRQNDFYRALTDSLGQLRQDNASAMLWLGLLSFLYGVFHAAGPGHGKIIISSYMLATERQLRRGIALSFAAALLQSFVAISLVGIAAAALRLTTSALNDATHWIGVGSYALVAGLGLWLVARQVLGLGHGHGHHHHDMATTAHHHLHAHDHDHPDHEHGHDHHDHNDAEGAHDHHHHVVLAEQAGSSWREALGVILAAGLRPCSGALIVLVFSLSQGIFLAGIVATLLMGVGTGLTVALLAMLAVSAKGIAGRLAGGRTSRTGAAIVWWLELLGGVLVLAFGVLLLLASL